MKKCLKGLQSSAVALGMIASAFSSPLMAQSTQAMLRQQPAATRPAPRPMNILLIMADDLAPRLGSYGAPVRTPNIDALARQGVQFDRAYAQFPWCGPSRASLLTGTRPNTTRVMDLTTPFRQALPDIKTLPEYFRGHGYVTARVGKIFHQGVPGDIGRSGPDDPQSWDEVVNPRGRDKDAENGALKNETPGIPYGGAMTWLDDDGADDEQTDGKVATAAIDLLREKGSGQKPFFLAVGFYRPHVPLVAPKTYFDLYKPGDMKTADETPASLAAVPSYTKAWEPNNFGMSKEQQQQIIRAYYASTSYVDSQIGRVLDELDRLGLRDNTIVVFTSDHGYLLGEHGQWQKNMLWDQNDQVPLIMRVPGLTKGGQRSPRTVELLDLYPTLTDLAGLPHYERNEGVSLRPLLQKPAAQWDRPALSQVRGGRSVRTERWRYIEWEEGKLGRELYDHRTDPGEHRNLAANPRYAKIVAQLRAKLPAGPVEARPKPSQYDAVRHCLGGYSGAPSGGSAEGRGGRGAGGEGGAGMKICEQLDP